MSGLSALKQFVNDMRRQKLRTALTMFGIFWGTCSIVLLFAFGTGLREQQIKQQKGLGENIAIYWPGVTAKEFKGLPKGRPVNFTEDDVALIKARSHHIERISPEYSRWNATLRVGKNSTTRQIKGVWPEFADMRNVIPNASGSRFINDADMSEKRRVMFIGDKLATDLFGSTDCVGKQALLNGVPFTVIGVMQPKQQNSSYGGRDERIAYIPSTTFTSMFSARHMNNFVMQVKPDRAMKSAEQEVYDILGARYRFDPTDREALSVWDVSQGVVFVKNFFFSFQAFLVGIGIATLITGGIGVSNIMNVVLEERTKEIGIKMALGARKAYILTQFIVETLLITGVGGVLGFCFAWLVVSLFPMLKFEEFIGTPRIDVSAGILAIVLLGFIGMIAGYFPARRAANLQPVQALKLF